MLAVFTLGLLLDSQEPTRFLLKAFCDRCQALWAGLAEEQAASPMGLPDPGHCVKPRSCEFLTSTPTWEGLSRLSLY